MRLRLACVACSFVLFAGDLGCSQRDGDPRPNEGGQGGSAGANGGSGGGGAGGARAGASGGAGQSAGSSGGAGSAGSSQAKQDAATPMDAAVADASVPAMDGKPATFDPTNSPAASFHGYRWEVPCAGAGYAPGDTCKWDAARFSKNKQATFTGQPGKLYAVSIRIRGVTEPRTYLVDGKVANLGDKPAFLAGGTPAPGNDYNVYRIVVSKPAKTYHLNAYRSVGHITFDVDYRATIVVEGGATVSLEAVDSNTEAIANFKRLVVPGIPPAPEPFNGQFLQLDVTGVEATN